MYNSTLALKSSVPGEQFSTADATSILKQAVESNMINLTYLQEQIDMLKKQELLKLHTNKISYDEKRKYWYTYFRDPEKGRVKKKRTTKEALERLIIDYYRENDEQLRQQEYSFQSWWEIWKERQKAVGVSDNTVLKYNSDYKRYFQGTAFEKMDIRQINEETITIFMIDRIQTLQLKKRAGEGLWTQVTGVFKVAKIRRKIQTDPCQFVDTRMFEKFYNHQQKAVEERTLSDDELELLKKQLCKDHEKNPSYIPSYAVELAIYTGMRSGELAALKWEDISFSKNIIVISKSEKYNRKTKEHIISDTKTRKTRYFPMEETLSDFFRNLMNIQMENGIINEFVFSNSNGKITGQIISHCMRSKCQQIGIPERGIHALRRTLNSKMRCDGVSATVAASLLGHTEQVNEVNYTYDITGLDSKREIVRRVIG